MGINTTCSFTKSVAVLGECSDRYRSPSILLNSIPCPPSCPPISFEYRSVSSCIHSPLIFPFLLLAAFSFGKSSEKLHTWFVGTKLYKDNLESYVAGKGMTWKTKIRVMIMVTLLMGFGFFMMIRKDLYIPCGILGGVWVFHILYFIFGVKTLKELQISVSK